MRIVVTGATGFVGRPLVERLSEMGHEIAVVSRTPNRAKEMLSVQEAWAWEELSACFRKPVDGVIHLAGETVQGRWTSEKASKVWDSRLNTTTMLRDAIEACEHTPSVWISASGIGFYGDGGERHLLEPESAGDDYFARLCVEWEGLVLAAQSPQLRVVCARFGIVLGEGGGALKVMLLPAKTGLSGPLGSGQRWWSWIALHDTVGALIFALENGSVRGPMNVVAPEPIRQRDFQRALCRALHRPAWFPAPAFGVRLILGQFADEVLSSKRVVPGVLKEHGFTWSFSSLADVFAAVLPKKQSGLVLPLLGAVALLGAPYGKSPHVFGAVEEIATGAGTLDVYLHAGMHMALVPWLLFVLYDRTFRA